MMMMEVERRERERNHTLELIAQMKLDRFNHVLAMKPFEYKGKYRVALATFVKFPIPFNFVFIFLICDLFLALSTSCQLYAIST